MNIKEKIKKIRLEIKNTKSKYRKRDLGKYLKKLLKKEKEIDKENEQEITTR